MRSRVDINAVGAGAQTGAVMVRCNSTAQNGYRAYASVAGGSGQWNIVKYTNNVPTSLATGSVTLATTGYHTYELVEDAGALTFLIDGAVIGSANDNTYSANTYCGFWLRNAGSRADNFYTDDLASYALDAAPEPIVQLAQAQGLTFTGTGTAWTPGTPGSPTFTADKGTLANQSVQSATQASADYTPPQVDDTVTFTDPSTGQTDAVALSTGFQVESGPDLTEVLDILGTPSPGHTVTGDLTTQLGEMTMPDPPPTVTDIIDWFVAGFIAATVPEALLDKLDALYGKLPAEQQILSLETLAQTELAWLNRNLGLLTDDVAAIAGEEELSLRQVINYLAGVPNLTHQDLHDDYNTLTSDGTYSLASLDNLLDLIRGDPPVSLRAVYDAIAALVVPSNQNLYDYLDWITGTHTNNLATLLTQINAALTNVNDVHDDLAAAQLAIQTDIDNHDANLEALFSVLTVVGEYNLGTVYGRVTTAINDINTLSAYLGTEIGLVRGDIAGVDTVVDAIKTKVDSLVNTDLSGVNTTLARIEDKIDELLAAGTRPTAPVWPGFANVVLGTPVALADQLVVAGPLHGVLVSVTGGGSKLSEIHVGARSYLFRAGEVTFAADTGQVEPWQYIGFDEAVYVPKALYVADSARFRVLGGLTGTVTPWTLAP